MTPSAAFFSPGKLVVLGEYGVLDGAPARVFAVNHGVRCEIFPADERLVDTPESDARFVGPALAAVDAPPARYRFLSSPRSEGPKPGLGSSAASVVVAVAAGRSVRGLPLDARVIHAIAAAVHAEVQGSGSGIDVAASAFGGSGRFQTGSWSEAPLPGIPWRAVATPQAAQTGPRVVQYRAWSGRSSFVDACAALDQVFDRDPIGATREALRLLRAMADEAGIVYQTPALDRVSVLAEQVGGAAKPSGAGGGDLAIAWLPDPVAAAAFERHVVADGLRLLPLQLSPGVGPAVRGA